jgi:hypothetical protein
MTENTFWQALRKKLVPRVYALKLNLRFAAGVPDAWLSGSEQDLWLENKYLQKLPPVVNVESLLSELQKNWLIKRHEEGRFVGVLVGSSDGHLYFHGLSWQSQVSREKWIQSSKTTKEIAEELIDLLGEVKRVPPVASTET